MVHHNLGEAIVHVDPREHRGSGHRVNWLVHQWVPSNEANDFIREVSGRLYERVIGFAWTLNEREQEDERNFRKEVQLEIKFSEITFVKTVIIIVFSDSSHLKAAFGHEDHMLWKNCFKTRKNFMMGSLWVQRILPPCSLPHSQLKCHVWYFT